MKQIIMLMSLYFLSTDLKAQSNQTDDGSIKPAAQISNIQHTTSADEGPSLFQNEDGTLKEGIVLPESIAPPEAEIPISENNDGSSAMKQNKTASQNITPPLSIVTTGTVLNTVEGLNGVAMHTNRNTGKDADLNGTAATRPREREGAVNLNGEAKPGIKGAPNSIDLADAEKIRQQKATMRKPIPKVMSQE